MEKIIINNFENLYFDEQITNSNNEDEYYKTEKETLQYNWSIYLNEEIIAYLDFTIKKFDNNLIESLIKTSWVKSEYRNKGLITYLYNKALNKYKENNYIVYTHYNSFDSNKEDQLLKLFYRMLGFKIINEEEHLMKLEHFIK
jgi:ribosomal protein S18 acetylase RimI-like enzyme